MKQPKYIQATDFLSDDLFIEWRLTRRSELDDYWTEFLRCHPESADAFDSAIQIFGFIRINSHTLSPEKSQKLLNRIFRTSSTLKRRRVVVWYFAAAAIVLLAASPLLWREYSKVKSLESVSYMIIGQSLPSQDIQFRLGDEVVQIKNDAEIHVSGNGSISIKDTKNHETTEYAPVSEPITHTLSVPNGKRSTLLLPDGSKVWLNAGTQVAFLSDFLQGERSIRVAGEIFIQVAEESRRPFFVYTPQMTVRVTGTTFNVSAYDNQPEESVVLVEGHVEIDYQGEVVSLLPYEKFSDGVVTSLNEREMDKYTSWTKGFLSFDNTTIYEVLETVGRYYNIEFREDEPRLAGISCSGKLILSDNIDEVFRSICLISNADFERIEETVTIIVKK